MAEGKRSFDLGTLLMVLILLCMLVAGLWMTGTALVSRFDELDTKISSRTEQIQSDIAALRNEIRATQSVKATAPAEAPAPAAVKKKAK